MQRQPCVKVQLLLFEQNCTAIKINQKKNVGKFISFTSCSHRSLNILASVQWIMD